MTVSAAEEKPKPRGNPLFGIGCLTSVGPWLACGNCLQQEPLLVERASEQKKLPPSKSKKLGPLLSAEEEYELRERAKAERAKAAWKRISRQASMEGPPEQRNSAGFRKAADALIRAARKREKAEGGDGLRPMLRRDLSTSESEKTGITDMQAEVMAAGFASPSLSVWGGHEAVLPQTEAMADDNLVRDQSTDDVFSRSQSSLLSANPLPALGDSGQSPAGSESSKPWLKLQLKIDDPAGLGSPPASAPPLLASVPLKGEPPVREDSEEFSPAPQKEFGPSLSFESRTWSMLSTRNSIDSPRLSQSQALLAKLGGPGPQIPIKSTPPGRRPNSPRRLAPKSPPRESKDSANFTALKQDAYSILMQQNESRLKKERQRRASVEGISLPKSPNQSPTKR